MADAAGRGVEKSVMRIARGGRESGKLRDAFRVRTAPGLSGRRLDRARVAATIFPAETKGNGATAPRILRQLFRRARRLRPAVSLSPRPQGRQSCSARRCAI